MNDFKFGILDVVNLLSLKIRSSSHNGFYVDCPFCGGRKKGKMRIHTTMNYFTCYRCGESDGMLGLYAKLHGISTSEAFKKINNALFHGEKTSLHRTGFKEVSNFQEVKLIPTAAMDKCHIAYTYLLSFLTLSDFHKDKLLNRGLSEFEIRKNGYKSIPVFGIEKLINALTETGICLYGIPGFYFTKDGKCKTSLNPKLSGIMIPVKSIEGYVTGIQIRLDNPIDGMKYMWFSSSKYENGASASVSPHFVGTTETDAIYLIEGALKADIAHYFTKKTFLAVAGVTQSNSLVAPLKTLKILGFNKIVESFDMDKKTNANVEKALLKTTALVQSMGFEMLSLTWDSKYNGLDDYFYNKIISKQ